MLDADVEGSYSVALTSLNFFVNYLESKQDFKQRSDTIGFVLEMQL